jgi:hypothetical protein
MVMAWSQAIRARVLHCSSVSFRYSHCTSIMRSSSMGAAQL